MRNYLNLNHKKHKGILMIFHKGEPNPHYDDFGYFNRLQSGNNLWGIACEFTIFGSLRVVVFPVNSLSITLNICAGNQAVHQEMIYQLVLEWLETFDESVKEWELQKEFPRFDIKPIYNDPNWPKNLKIIANRISNSKKNTELLNSE